MICLMGCPMYSFSTFKELYYVFRLKMSPTICQYVIIQTEIQLIFHTHSTEPVNYMVSYTAEYRVIVTGIVK
jgi:hypothetical protein